MRFSAAAVAALATTVAAKDGRTFAVLHFQGNGPLTEGRSDPIVGPGGISSHVHTVQGGNAFGNSATGESMLKSTCSTANIAGDKSAYWAPKLYFHDQKAGTYEPVPLFYMNVYYFFEGTNDNIQAFPVGLQMVSGNSSQRGPPASGNLVLDPSQGPIQPAQVTCPRSSYDPPSYPAGSDGSKAGMQDSNNKGAGAGFPFAECDGYASPMRTDLHFPSCYNPAKALTDYRNNVAFPTDKGNGKQDCPAGWIHTPHIFYELYWNTPLFKDRWTPNQASQPFVFSNGDATGFSMHGDFLAAWDTKVLQQIIDNCNAGDSGMDKCPGLIGGLNPDDNKCHIPNPSPEQIDGVLSALPGNNHIFGWQYGSGGSSSGSGSGSSGSSPSNPKPSSSSKASSPSPATAPPADYATTKAATTMAISTTKATTTKAPATTPAAYSTTKAAPTITTTKTMTTTVTKMGGPPTTVKKSSPATTTKKSSTSAPSSPAKTLHGWKYAGCYQDTGARVITGEKFANIGTVSNDKCVAHCQKKGFSLAGTEFSGQCFCGNSAVGSKKIAASACNMKCSADAKDTCGGPMALTVFSKDGTVQLSAAKHYRFLRP